MRLFMVAALAIVVLAGCASISREECEIGDWDAIGRSDGAAGLDAQTQFTRHQRACARVDIAPDRAQWQQGYAQGLARYCTPIGGLEAGRTGRIYRNVCPAGTEAAFLNAYRFGERAHRKRQQIAAVEAEASSLRSSWRVIGGPGDPFPGDAGFLQLELLHLNLELTRLRAELRQIEREIDQYRRSLG